jgi:hypothetical protein
LNPGPHGPELCDISFKNGGNDRFPFEIVAPRRGGVVIRSDSFAELLHELLQNRLALKLPLPYLHTEEDAREGARARGFRWPVVRRKSSRVTAIFA